MEAVAVAFSMAWQDDAVQGGAGDDGRAACWRRSAASCTGASPGAGMRCSSWRTRCCAGRTGCTCWRSCRWSRSAAAATARSMTRSTRAGSASRGCAGRWPRLPLPPWDDGRIRLAADVSNWLRPDAATSPDRLFCHCYARGKGNAQLIPGWPYSVIAALETGPYLLDAAAGRGPARPGRRRHRGDRGAGPRGRRADHRRRALARRRPGHRGRLRRRL